MNCPNYTNCQLIHTGKLSVQENTRQIYIRDFCTAGKNCWQKCKRYETSQSLHFCPDFVLPDTALSLDEIIDLFEQNLN